VRYKKEKIESRKGNRYTVTCEVNILNKWKKELSIWWLVVTYLTLKFSLQNKLSCCFHFLCNSDLQTGYSFSQLGLSASNVMASLSGPWKKIVFLQCFLPQDDKITLRPGCPRDFLF
jgi:hypothetical protein